jgi:hypothetical protein
MWGTLQIIIRDSTSITKTRRSAGVVPPTDDESAAAAASALVWRVEGLAQENGCHPQLYDAVQVRVSPWCWRVHGGASVSVGM